MAKIQGVPKISIFSTILRNLFKGAITFEIIQISQQNELILKEEAVAF